MAERHGTPDRTPALLKINELENGPCVAFGVPKSVYMGRPPSIIVVQQVYIKLADQYHSYLIGLGYNPVTSKTRFNYVREFLSWLERNGIHEIRSVRTSEVATYYGYLKERVNKQTGGRLSRKTTQSHIQVLQLLFTMLQSKGVIKENPCTMLEVEKPKQGKTRKVLTQEEIKILYQMTDNHEERAILSLAYGCGLRVSELVNVNIADVKLSDKILVVQKGKGNKKRLVPMSSGVVKDLRDYYFEQRPKLATGRDYRRNESAFMLNWRGGRMQKYTYNARLKMILQRTNSQTIMAKKITIHHLRHSIATHLIEQGIGVEQVRQFLGHRQLETTQIYTHISPEQLKRLTNES